MNKKISVIVPMYNVEKYIHKCIKSIINQTYKNIEIILVDDGSPDNCGIIADEYASHDNRIKVIHKKNGGLSSARNAGLKEVTGSYIGFVDSDDWIEPTMYEEMISYMIKHNCDLVECGVNLISNSAEELYHTKENEIISGKKAVEIQMSSDDNTRMPRISVWSKLFKKEFWRDKMFPEGKVHEDYMLTCEALYNAESVGLIKKGLYNHLTENSTSIMNSKFGEKDLFLEEQYYNRVTFFELRCEEKLRKIAEKNYYLLLLTLFWRCKLNSMKQSSYYVKLINDNKVKIRKVKFGFRRRLEFKMFYLSPNIYIFLRKKFMKVRNR